MQFEATLADEYNGIGGKKKKIKKKKKKINDNE